MRYDYRCKNCGSEDRWFVFETNHGMTERPKVKCPECDKDDTEQVYLDSPMIYTRGNGWLDVKGRRRDMHLWKLQNDDPYKGMREPGEAHDLATRMKAQGHFSKKPVRFTPTNKKKTKK